MMLAERRTGNGAMCGGRALVAALLLATGLVIAMSCHQQAWASNSAESSVDASGEPVFGLPPIVVQVPDHGGSELKVIIFKAALVFDEVEPERISDSQRIAKSLLPKIMDSVISGVQNHRFTDWSKTEEVTQVVLDSSNAVLKPYGVVIKKLRMQDLGIH